MGTPSNFALPQGKVNTDHCKDNIHLSNVFAYCGEVENARAVAKIDYNSPNTILHVHIIERILTRKETCEMLHISEQTLIKYMKKGYIKSTELGKSLFLYSDIVRLISANKGKIIAHLGYVEHNEAIGLTQNTDNQ